MPSRILSLFATLLLTACSDRPPTTPETRPVLFPNAGNTALYDVDPEDPYEIGDGEFLTLRPGAAADTYDEGLIAPIDGSPDRYHIFGRRSDTLGYVRVADGRIVSIHIDAATVVTQNGLRVGTQRGEVRQRQHTIDRTEFRYDRPTGDSARVTELILR